ncbi:TQXA domain-containing protein [Streptomyces sp. NPDC088785]|uniref:TQXA domain-containing protein n=1 Tax=Streptomyces sp. NPDC088785 TaxID=3365897 RepID=UPI0038074501
MYSVFTRAARHGRSTVRIAAAVLLSGLVTAGAISGAGPARAVDGAPEQGGASAVISGMDTHGMAVVHEDGKDEQVSAGLFRMIVDGGGMLQTYCVDIHNPTRTDARYQETPWSGTSLGANKNAGKIRWILENSYPQVNDLAALAREAGTTTLTEQDAAAGTQVAIWRFSDQADVDAVSPAAEKLADHLQRSAVNLAEPRASLTLTPQAVSGHPGERVGPVTVRTDAGGVSLMPLTGAAEEGVRVVDKKGHPVTSAADGSRLYFDIPKDADAGSAALSVQASTTVPVGRAFTSDTRSQAQILAGSSESTVAAGTTATWARQGAVPALSAQKNCAEGGVDITVANKGDEPFTFALMGKRYTAAAEATRTVTIPLQEDQAYDFTITGPHGFEKRLRGILDCRTTSAAHTDDKGLRTQALIQPSPASVGGTGAAGTDLADTGTSNATPVIAGTAIVLVLVGGAALVLVRKKKAPAEEPSGDE